MAILFTPDDPAEAFPVLGWKGGLMGLGMLGGTVTEEPEFNQEDDLQCRASSTGPVWQLVWS